MTETIAKVKGERPPAGATAAASTGVPLTKSSHQRVLDQMSQPVPETTTLLKSCVGASVALAQVNATVARSVIGASYASMSRSLDVAGALLLDGEPLDAEMVFLEDTSRRSANFRHALDARSGVVDGLQDATIDAAWLRRCADQVLGRQNTVRGRALGLRERRQLAERQRLVNDAGALTQGLEAWARFVERDAGDAENLLFVGAALRRWLLLRPFVKMNASIGFALVDALMQAESAQARVTLALAWRCARYDNVFRVSVADDESTWLAWWLGAVRSTSEEALAHIVEWEREFARLQQSPLLRDLGCEGSSLVALCSPSFSMKELARCLQVDQRTARSIIDALLGADILIDLGVVRSGRSGQPRYSNRRLYERGLSPSLAMNIAM